ncbi:hypothetical protein ACLQ2R_01030 [Streptosporangium sp. DT93]|uniref:hypothetical protein n=1 Tax=Streptosporangium sp. DT93 TaxID=3393428 RepID=UPI003CEAEB64
MTGLRVVADVPSTGTLGLRVGETVEVLGEAEILATLDERGELDGLPFMPEMLAWCGRRLTVHKVAHKLCDTISGSGMRRMERAVHLTGARCDGAAHGGCQTACQFYWKEAWLRRATPQASSSRATSGGTATNGTVTNGTVTNGGASNGGASDGGVSDGTVTNGAVSGGVVTNGAVSGGAVFNGGRVAPGALVAPGARDTPATGRDIAAGRTLLPILSSATRKEPGPDGEERFSCQATELLRAAPACLPLKDVGQYVADVRTGNVGVSWMLRSLLVGLFNRYQQAARRLLPRWLWIRGGMRWGFVRGEAGAKTPTRTLDLRPGELVRVRPKEEILKTLNDDLLNRGMGFEEEMSRYCGHVARVSARIERCLDEKTGRMLRMKNPCIVLEGVVCAGAYNVSCPREFVPFWREIWLERVAEGAEERVAEGAGEGAGRRVEGRG